MEVRPIQRTSRRAGWHPPDSKYETRKSIWGRLSAVSIAVSCLLLFTTGCGNGNGPPAGQESREPEIHGDGPPYNSEPLPDVAIPDGDKSKSDQGSRENPPSPVEPGNS
jgi:hypothetical protein